MAHHLHVMAPSPPGLLPTPLPLPFGPGCYSMKLHLPSQPLAPPVPGPLPQSIGRPLLLRRTRQAAQTASLEPPFSGIRPDQSSVDLHRQVSIVPHRLLEGFPLLPRHCKVVLALVRSLAEVVIAVLALVLLPPGTKPRGVLTLALAMSLPVAQVVIVHALAPVTPPPRIDLWSLARVMHSRPPFFGPLRSVVLPPTA